MSPEDIEKHINRICCGFKYISVTDKLGRDTILTIKSLTPADRNFIEFISDKSTEEAKKRNICSKLELLNIYKMRGVWGEKDSELLEEKRSNLKKLYNEKKRLFGSKLKKISRNIKIQEDELKDILNKKTSLFYPAIDSYVSKMRSLAVVFCCTCSETGKKFWKTWRDMEECDDIYLINNVLDEIGKDIILTTKDMREIARSGQWRFRWNAAKKIGDLFGKPVSELDAEQQSLIYWSQVYDSAYEAYERPSDEIINDDDALDKWFEEQDKKQKKDSFEKTGRQGRIEVSKNVMKHGEVFVVARGPLAPTAPSYKEIEGLNDELTAKFKEKEIRTIKEKGIINEKELRHRKNNIARKIIGSKAAILNRNKMSGHAKGRDKKILPGENIS